ncbi:MAG: hypothetical protein MRY83_18420, partial [Flavobacteriales bacterium]|nr:hypothetical protein [Flavobacteriales bacterium]
MKERITAILEENIFSEKVFFFRRVIYLVVLWNSISWGLDASQFFGPERLQLSYPAYSKLDMLLNILCHSDWQSGYLVVL